MKQFTKYIIPLLFSACIIAPLTSKSQVDTSTTQKLLQYIMQPVDKNQIPTGF